MQFSWNTLTKWYNALYILAVFSVVPACSAKISHPTHLQGTMEFPSSIKTIPSMRVYYGGNKIKTEQRNQALSFSIPRDNSLKQVYMLITPKIMPINAKNKTEDLMVNTVDHLSVPNEQAYKFYRLTLTTNDGKEQWHIAAELDLNKDRYIPDNTIIILWHPDNIDSLTEMNGAYLPKVCCSDNTRTLFGSEQGLHEFATMTLLEAMNSDPFHGIGKGEKIKLADNRILRVTA